MIQYSTIGGYRDNVDKVLSDDSFSSKYLLCACLLTSMKVMVPLFGDILGIDNAPIDGDTIITVFSSEIGGKP